jgi:formylglycine-generating enzyme required for sulfatase activity
MVYSRMADIFISYSKQHAQLTEDLARDLEAEGYTTWWDTSLLPDDVFFPETIRTEIKAAKVVIVIWTEHAVTSRWVYSEATEGDEQGKLLQVRDAALDIRLVPMPFKAGNISLVTDRAKVFATLARRGIAPSGAQATTEAARFKAEGRVEIDAALLTNPHGRWFLPGAGKTEWFRDLEAGPEMVVVPAGKFLMGSPEDEPREGPQHEVTIPKPFAVGRCAVTRGQFADFVAATGHDTSKSWREPGFSQDDSHPVVRVNLSDARAYAGWLSRSTGALYRLLSEAEWEYTCRAGTVTAFWWGSSITPEQANYNGSGELYEGGGKKGEYRKQTVPVKLFEANPWGLFQVHGNVWEWCEDLWHDGYADKPETLIATGGAWTIGSSGEHVLRGGSWIDIPQSLRAAYRRHGFPVRRNFNFGFRVARTIIL